MKKPSCCWESRSYCTVSNSRPACWVGDDGYCRRGNFGSSLVHSTFL